MEFEIFYNNIRSYLFLFVAKKNLILTSKFAFTILYLLSDFVQCFLYKIRPLQIVKTNCELF